MVDLGLRRYANSAPVTTLNGAITAAATTLTVDGASGFPEPDFTIKIESEIMLVTDVTGLVLTVVRAYDSSLPASGHGDGITVTHVLTQDDFDHRVQDVIHSPPFGEHDDDFDDVTDSLTNVNLGTSVWTEAYGVQSVVFSDQATNDVTANVKSIGTLGIGHGVQTAVRMMGVDDDLRVGPLFSSGGTTTDSVVWQHLLLQPQSGNLYVGLRSGTFTDASTSHYSDQSSIQLADRIHMRLIWVSVNAYRAWYSIDGVSWTDFGKGSFFVTGINPPTRFGIGVSAWGSGSTDKLATFDYLRIWEP